MAVAVAAVVEIDGLERALDPRSLVGQALGIAMERYDLNAAAAMALLVRLSSHENTKLRDLALAIIDTRVIGGRKGGPSGPSHSGA